jgi:hypothetical protein
MVARRMGSTKNPQTKSLGRASANDQLGKNSERSTDTSQSDVEGISYKMNSDNAHNGSDAIDHDGYSALETNCWLYLGATWLQLTTLVMAPTELEPTRPNVF